jgi:hypothetical protein
VASLLTKDPEAAIIILYRAGIAQVVEHLLPKQRVAGSNPVSRSSLNVASRKVSVACPGAAGQPPWGVLLIPANPGSASSPRSRHPRRSAASLSESSSA